jgi:hypothetical protein
MNWECYERKRWWPNLRYYPSIYLERLRKTTKTLSQDTRCPGRDSSPSTPEYETGVLTSWLWRPVNYNKCSYLHNRATQLNFQCCNLSNPFFLLIMRPKSEDQIIKLIWKCVWIWQACHRALNYFNYRHSYTKFTLYVAITLVTKHNFRLQQTAAIPIEADAYFQTDFPLVVTHPNIRCFVKAGSVERFQLTL